MVLGLACCKLFCKVKSLQMLDISITILSTYITGDTAMQETGKRYPGVQRKQKIQSIVIRNVS